MKSTGTLFFILFSQLVCAQTWKTVDIDDRVTISVPSHFNQTDTNGSITIESKSSSYTLKIERTTLPEAVNINIDTANLLGPYARGFLSGIGFSDSVDFIDDIDGVIGNIKTKTILLSYEEKVMQILFMGIDRIIYSITYTGTSESPTDERQKLFSSIQLK